ncbi:MAG: GDP-L-fucose synthase [Thermodesulfobacteriota bacterium]
MEKMDKIYVAGHLGVAGSAIVRRLRREGFQHVVTRAHHELELTDAQAVAAFFAQEKPSYVFLASEMEGGIGAAGTLQAGMLREHLDMQSNVIQQSWLHGVRRLLFLGSSCAYPRDCAQPLREESLMAGSLLQEADLPLAIIKIAGIEMCWAYNRQYGTRFIPVMPANCYGPCDNFDLETSRVLPALLRKFHLAKLAQAGEWQAISDDERCFGVIPFEVTARLGIAGGAVGKAGNAVPVWGSGKPCREFLHADDLADACHFLMELPDLWLGEYDPSTLLFNIGTGEDISIADLARLVAGIVGYEGEIVFDASRPDCAPPRKSMNLQRMTREGWTASISLAEGIRETYDWYLSQTCEEEGRAEGFIDCFEWRGCLAL